MGVGRDHSACRRRRRGMHSRRARASAQRRVETFGNVCLLVLELLVLDSDVQSRHPAANTRARQGVCVFFF